MRLPCDCWTAILNLHERIENKLFLDRTRKDSNFKRPHICATLFQIEKCCSVGIDHDTAEFAVESIRRWWKEMGHPRYPKARRVLITADCGGKRVSLVETRAAEAG